LSADELLVKFKTKRFKMLFKQIEYRGIDHMANIPIADHIPGLSKFDASYLNNDHHVRTFMIGGQRLGAGPSDFNVHLSDMDDGIFGNGQDQVQITVRYTNFQTTPYFSGGGLFTVAGVGDTGHDVAVPIPALQEDEVLVLKGFEFIEAENTNHHIRTIQVRYFTEPSEFIVRFRDDTDKDDLYNYRIHYLILKKRCEEDLNYCLDGIHTQRAEFIKETTITKTVPGMGLLSGFSFQFTDGDHHVRRIAVDVENFNNISLAFSDNEERHRVLAFVDYVVLKTN
jgi:hypothetical protein